MSKFIELPVKPLDLKTTEYSYMPVNIERIIYIMPLPKDKCRLYFSDKGYIDVDIDIIEMKEIVDCTEQAKSADDLD
jgi:hypothetical protein